MRLPANCRRAWALLLFHNSIVAASAEVLVSLPTLSVASTSGAAGDARFLAFEPGNLRLQIERAGLQIGGELERHEQDDLVVVTVGGDFGGRQFFRERPLDFAGGDARRAVAIRFWWPCRRRRDFSSTCASPAPSSNPRRPDRVAGPGGVGGQNQPHLGVGGVRSEGRETKYMPARMVPMRRTGIRCQI